MMLTDVTGRIATHLHTSTLMACLLMIPTAGALAQPHVHGVAQLLLVQDNARIHMEFTSPAINMVGFEHSPRTDAERQAIDEVRRALANLDSILTLSALDCDVDSIETAVTGMISIDGDTHNHHRHLHDADHAEFTATFELSCSRAQLPSELVITAFDNFQDLESIHATWSLQDTQGAQHLPRQNTRLRLRP
ncbi:MAG: DUF2796 domain-containing protein [Pseudohongiella sp.]|uniref:ZrgA family zinc uptake protein n=1 Tax=Pseudohongiella sp. TaxID=1979412 RepID=UPI0034A06502